MASRGHRLGSRIAYDNGGLMHNLRAYLGYGNRKEHFANAEFGGRRCRRDAYYCYAR
jgi:hypothetical protein